MFQEWRRLTVSARTSSDQKLRFSASILTFSPNNPHCPINRRNSV
ncbi:3-hydroxyacyl-CoA-acyl carrier protein transferase [Pseudomonas coronafaciens pv. coronafaciens]|nr:3-hydroxyacyl-CoA-acyl carrier protein transferase [Pseudomonas coronafaciens pv. coronafaciens]